MISFRPTANEFAPTQKRMREQDEAAAPPPAPPEPSGEERLLTEIRDLLAKR